MTPVQQFGLLKHEYPESTGSICAGLMTWQGDFTPSALSDTYRLKIVYRVGELPKAYIVSPKPLPLAEGATKLPHTYNYSDGKASAVIGDDDGGIPVLIHGRYLQFGALQDIIRRYRRIP